MKQVGKWLLPDSDVIFTKSCVNQETSTYGHAFQIKYLKKIIELSDTSGSIIDAGANIGLFSYAFAKNFNYVFSFEPVPINYECLEENTKSLDNIELFHCALGISEGSVRMLGRLNNTGSFRVVDNDIKQKKHEGNYKNIPVKPMDYFNFKNISTIKIDCEGFEYNVLQGASSLIKEHKPLLCIEFTALNKGGNQNTHNKVNKFLKANGYEKVWEFEDDAIFK